MSLAPSSLRLAIAGAALVCAGAGAPLAAQSAAPPAPTRSAAQGVFTEAQSQRGETTFRTICAACHMIAEFSGEPWLKRWPTVGGLFDVVSSSMPQDNPGALTPQQYSDVLAYFLKANGFPTGAEELPSAAPPLNAIAIPPKPPQ